MIYFDIDTASDRSEYQEVLKLKKISSVLDQETSIELMRALEEGAPTPDTDEKDAKRTDFQFAKYKSIDQCKSCEMYFLPEIFPSHKCMGQNSTWDQTKWNADENINCLKKYFDRYNTLHVKNEKRMEDMLQKINLLIASKNDKQIKPSHDCAICSRKFVHETGRDRHLEKHVGEILPPSGVAKSVQMVCRCACGELFLEDEDAFQHVIDFHIIQHENEGNVFHVDSEVKVKVDKRLSDYLENETQEYYDAVAKLQDTSLVLPPMQDLLTPMFVCILLQCEFCDLIFADKMSLFFHEAEHHPEEGFQCTICKLFGLSLKDILIHRRCDCTVNLIEEHRLKTMHCLWVCNVCEEEFECLEHLIQHRYQAYHFFPRLDWTSSHLVFSCEFCDFTGLEVHELIQHHDTKHVKKMVRREQHQNHAKKSASAEHRTSLIGTTSTNYTSTKYRQYLCDVCGKSYTQSSHLWQHLRFHRGVKPFACSVEGCTRRFTIRPDLNDHIRKCHTGERPYHCLICDKRFLTGSVFYQHRLIHRGERRYGCVECPKRFYRADALKNHQRIHSGEKPFGCGYCSKNFRQKGDRDKHIKARHPNAPAPSPKQKVKFPTFGKGRTKNNPTLKSVKKPAKECGKVFLDF